MAVRIAQLHTHALTVVRTVRDRFALPSTAITTGPAVFTDAPLQTLRFVGGNLTVVIDFCVHGALAVVGAVVGTFLDFAIRTSVLGFAVAGIVNTSTVVRASIVAEAIGTGRAGPSCVALTVGMFAQSIANTFSVETAISRNAPYFATVVSDVTRVTFTGTCCTITFASAGAVFGAVEKITSSTVVLTFGAQAPPVSAYTSIGAVFGAEDDRVFKYWCYNSRFRTVNTLKTGFAFASAVDEADTFLAAVVGTSASITSFANPALLACTGSVNTVTVSSTHEVIGVGGKTLFQGAISPKESFGAFTAVKCATSLP